MDACGLSSSLGAYWRQFVRWRAACQSVRVRHECVLNGRGNNGEESTSRRLRLDHHRRRHAIRTKRKKRL